MFENKRKAILYILCIFGLILFIINNFRTDALLFFALELASVFGIYLLSRCAQDVKAEITILIFLAITLSSAPDATFQVWQTVPLFIIYPIVNFTQDRIFIPLFTIGASFLIFPSAIWLAPVMLISCLLLQANTKRITIVLAALSCPVLYYALFRELITHDSMETAASFFDQALHISTPFAFMHPITYLLLAATIIPAVHLLNNHNYLSESSMYNMQHATLVSFASIVVLYFIFNTGMGAGPIGFYIAIPAALTSGILFSSGSNRKTDSLFYIFSMILLLNTLTNYFSF